MRIDELFRSLGYMAGTIGAQVRETCAGVPLDEFDLTGPAPVDVALHGPAQVVVSQGPVFRIDIEGDTGEYETRFARAGDRLVVTGGHRATVVRITLPAVARLAVAGSGRLAADKLAPDGELAIAGSGRLEVGGVDGGRLKVSIAGSGRLAIDGRADALELSIAGSGSCDAEGLAVDSASVHVAGSGDAIFACNGQVEAHLMGSGNVIVLGAARCSVHAFGSGTVTCEREREPAD